MRSIFAIEAVRRTDLTAASPGCPRVGSEAHSKRWLEADWHPVRDGLVRCLALRIAADVSQSLLFWRVVLVALIVATLTLFQAYAAIRGISLVPASLAVGVVAGAIVRSWPGRWPGSAAMLLALAIFSIAAWLEAMAVLSGALGLTPGEMWAALDTELVFALWWQRRSPLARAMVPAATLLAGLIARADLSGRKR